MSAGNELNLHDGYAPRRLAEIQRAMNEALAAIVDPATGERPFQNATTIPFSNR